jgi:hypothetical protein
MNLREKLLAAAVVALVAAWAGSSWLADYRDALAARRTAVEDAKIRLLEANSALTKGRKAVEQLEHWQDRSLPSNRETALSLYKAWLLAKAKDAGLAVDDIKPSPRTVTSPAYAAVGYQMEASGSLSAVAAMLYEFYRSPQLQQITHLRLSRPVGQSQLQLTLEVEALSLPGAVATNTLPTGDPRPLRLASLEAYQKNLVERDLVTVYTPRGTTPESTPDSQAARFSATVPGAGGLQAWINIPATGETLHLSAGDTLTVAGLDAKVVSIEPRALVLQTGETTLRVALGQPLRAGNEIEAAPAASNAPPTRERASPPPG